MVLTTSADWRVAHKLYIWKRHSSSILNWLTNVSKQASDWENSRKALFEKKVMYVLLRAVLFQLPADRGMETAHLAGRMEHLLQEITFLKVFISLLLMEYWSLSIQVSTFWRKKKTPLSWGNLPDSFWPKVHWHNTREIHWIVPQMQKSRFHEWE